MAGLSPRWRRSRDSASAPSRSGEHTDVGVAGHSAGEHDLRTAPEETEEAMRRLNFLAEEPWDEVEDLRRARWFGHPFGTDMLGASLTELLPGSPGSPLHMHYGVEEMFFVLSGTPTVRTPEGEEQLSPRRRVLPRRPRRAPRPLEPDRRAGSATRHLDQAIPRCRRLPGAGRCLGGDAPSRATSARRR